MLNLRLLNELLSERGSECSALFRACHSGNPALPEEVSIQTLC
jgi:hypothetical protein